MDEWTRQELVGQPVVDRDGEHVGTVSEVFLDDVTSEPEWLRVSVGALRERQSFVPLRGGQLLGASLRVPYDRELIDAAADFGLEAHLPVDAVESLRHHYGVVTGITPPVEDLRESPAEAHAVEDGRFTAASRNTEAGEEGTAPGQTSGS